jgi:hypothetical protein
VEKSQLPPYASFVDSAKFLGVSFGMESNFTKTLFYNDIKFIAANFGDITRFRNSTFRDRVHFLHDNFGELADFSNCWFESQLCKCNLNYVNLTKILQDVAGSDTVGSSDADS